jgi:hypothetical protein
MLLLTFVLAPRFAATHRKNSILEVVMMIVLLDAYGLAGLIAAAPLAVALDVLGRALEETTATAARVGNLAESVQALSDKVRVAAAPGAAVGPAVAAAVRAFRAPAHIPTAIHDASAAAKENFGRERAAERH